MSFYLDRTGQAEGPYEDQQILQMIQSGQLREGNICPPGGNQWMPLHAHPPFAQALQAASSGGPGMGPPPGGASGAWGPGAAPSPPGGASGGYPGMGAPAGGPGMGPPPGGASGAWGPGAAGPPPGGASGYTPMGAAPGGPGGYGMPNQPVSAMPAGPPAGTDAARPAAKKGSAGLIIGIVAAILLLGAGVAVAAFFLLRSGPQLSATVPKDIEIYVEMPSVKKTALDFHGQDYINTDKLEAKKTIDDLTTGIADAFEIPKPDARDVALAFDSFALAVRKPTKRAEGAMLFGFGSASAVEKLLGSKRFTAQGSAGKGGKKYELKRKDVPSERRKDLPFAEKAFVDLRTGGNDVLVWFEKQKLLVFGEEPLLLDIAGVIEEGKDPLTKNSDYKEASKHFESGASMIVYVDSSLLKALDSPEQKKLVDKYFKNASPFAGSVKLTDAGMLMNVTGTLSGDGMPKDNAYTPAASIKLPQKLPAETVAYLAFSSKTNLSPKEAEDMLTSRIGDADQKLSEDVKEGLSKLEETLGFGLKTVYEAMGDQGVIAVVADKAYQFGPGTKPKDALEHFAIAYIQEIKEKGSAEKIVSNAKQKLFEGLLKEAFKLTPDGVGFSAEPVDAKEGMPSVQVKFVDNHLFIAAGAGALVGKTLSALKDGKDSLGDDGAHKSAIGALPGDAHAYLWVDTGRIMAEILKSSPQIEQEVSKRGFSTGAIRMTGNDRVTSALSIGWKVKDGRWDYQVDGLNLLAAAPIGMLLDMARPRSDDFGDTADLGSPAGVAQAGGLIGVAECDEYLRKMSDCIPKMPASVQATMKDSLEKTRESWSKAATYPASKASLAQACKAMVDSVQKMPYCK